MGWNLPSGCTDKDIDDAAPQNEQELDKPDEEAMGGFTKGPWQVEECGRIIGPERQHPFDVTIAWVKNCEEAEDNCHLIAAAPELLEALEDLDRAVQAFLACTDDSERGYLEEESFNASAAIARAKGAGT